MLVGGAGSSGYLRTLTRASWGPFAVGAAGAAGAAHRRESCVSMQWFKPVAVAASRGQASMCRQGTEYESHSRGESKNNHDKHGWQHTLALLQLMQGRDARNS